jgi:hypothetical protein
MDLGVTIGVGVVGLVVLGAVLVVAREVVAWYFKTNEALGKLEKMETTLRSIDKSLAAMAERSGAVKPTKPEWTP